MGLNVKQLEEYVVRPALEEIGMYSEVAVDLILGTAAQESRFEYLHQLGKGPAVSIYQIEPATYKDYWLNFLKHRPQLAKHILKVCNLRKVPSADHMLHDLKYATIMCRIHYRRIRAPLPQYGDLDAYAAYYKKFYNTIHGKATEEEFKENYHRYVGKRQ
jgi:hypothetical protein